MQIHSNNVYYSFIKLNVNPSLSKRTAPFISVLNMVLFIKFNLSMVTGEGCPKLLFKPHEIIEYIGLHLTKNSGEEEFLLP